MSSTNVLSQSSPGWMRGLMVTAVLGGVLFALGLFIEPKQAWGGYLMGFVLFVSLALAGGLFLCVLTLANARWATALQRIPEAMTTALPAGALLGILLIGGMSSLYEWTHPSAVEGNALLEGKAAYLNLTGFVIRMVVFFALWIWLTRGMVNASRRQDRDGDPRHSRRKLTYALLFLPIFAVTYSLAGVDWVKSLEPEWFSTIYGLVMLSSLGCAGLAVCLILAITLEKGPLRGVVRDEHLDDMGKIGIGFALFWGYIWYCQYMLIWYTNMPEETGYYHLRSQGGWKILSMVNVAMNWGIPFFALMPRFVRRSRTWLLRIAWLMLAGQVVNLYMLVEPALMGAELKVGLWDLPPVIGALALFFWLTMRGLLSAPPVPTGDPHLDESLSYHA